MKPNFQLTQYWKMNLRKIIKIKTHVNLSNPSSKSWDRDNLIKSKFKKIIKLNPQ